MFLALALAIPAACATELPTPPNNDFERGNPDVDSMVSDDSGLPVEKSSGSRQVGCMTDGAAGPLVPGIRSSFRVSSHICEHPRETLDDERYELVDRVSEWRFLPALTMTGHLDSPQLHGVTAEPEVPERVLVRA
jgi:hypothetical protein